MQTTTLDHSTEITFKLARVQLYPWLNAVMKKNRQEMQLSKRGKFAACSASGVNMGHLRMSPQLETKIILSIVMLHAGSSDLQESDFGIDAFQQHFASLAPANVTRDGQDVYRISNEQSLKRP